MSAPTWTEIHAPLDPGLRGDVFRQAVDAYIAARRARRKASALSMGATEGAAEIAAADS